MTIKTISLGSASLIIIYCTKHLLIDTTKIKNENQLVASSLESLKLISLYFLLIWSKHMNLNYISLIHSQLFSSCLQWPNFNINTTRKLTLDWTILHSGQNFCSHTVLTGYICSIVVKLVCEFSLLIELKSTLFCQCHDTSVNVYNILSCSTSTGAFKIHHRGDRYEKWHLAILPIKNVMIKLLINC